MSRKVSTVNWSVFQELLLISIFDAHNMTSGCVVHRGLSVLQHDAAENTNIARSRVCLFLRASANLRNIQTSASAGAMVWYTHCVQLGTYTGPWLLAPLYLGIKASSHHWTLPQHTDSQQSTVSYQNHQSLSFLLLKMARYAGRSQFLHMLASSSNCRLQILFFLVV